MTITSSAARAVLGIDAAWTPKQPSGVALAVEAENGWRLAAVEASYDHFLGRANGTESSEKKTARLQAGCRRASRGRAHDLRPERRSRRVDMPMSRRPITGRQASRPSRLGALRRQGRGTHSARQERPGTISDKLRVEFEAEGYALCTAPPAQGLIEVYPHPALIEFLKAERRLEYKAGKTGVYWPALSLDERHLNSPRRLGAHRRGARAALSGASRSGCRGRIAPRCAAGASRPMRTSSTRLSAPPWPSPVSTGRRSPMAT